MEKGRGFLIHMVEVYPMLVPHLKGIHLTFESWRPDQDQEGWKYTQKQWLEILEDMDFDLRLNDGDYDKAPDL
eukprot:7062738-Ditylum_brightwellii.AAC.1